MNIESVLEDLGLKKNKATVYLAALQVGKGSVVDIARKAHLPRTTVHEILQSLIDRGLVSFVSKGKKRIYTVEPPEKLHTLLKDQQRKLQSAMPELRSLLNTRGLRPRVRFYEGIEGVKTVFEDTLTVHDNVLCGILSMEDLYELPGKDFMDDYVRRRVEAGITLQVIRSQTKEVEETWPTSTAENRELRYAPSECIFPMTMYLYDKKVGIIGTKKETYGIIIESDDFYQTQKFLFNILWDVSKITQKAD